MYARTNAPFLNAIGRWLAPALLVSLATGQILAENADTDVPAGLAAAMEATLSTQNLSPLKQIGTPFEGVTSALQAPNHGLDMQSFFLEDGVRILPMVGEERWSFGMELDSMARGEARREFEGQAPTRNGERVEYQRHGVTEWYLNRADGLEQGFDIDARPFDAQDGPLVLELALEDGLETSEVTDSRLLLEATSGAGRMSLGQLFTVDATGVTLPSHFEATANGFAIVVDDSRAIYPITIDPLIVNEEDKFFIEKGVPREQFGRSIDVSGLRAVVGASGTSSHAGAAYVFFRNNGTWELEAKLTDIINEAGCFFGYSVSIAGSTIAVGAFGSNHSGFDAGLVFLYELDQNGWLRTDLIDPLTPQNQSYFGYAVEIQGPWMFVGAPFRNVPGPNGTNHGATFVFEKQAGVWTYRQMLSPTGNIEDLNFGKEIATNGTDLAISAPDRDLSLGTTGSVYMYEYNAGNDLWEYQQVLGTFGARGFGTGIDFYHSRLAIGAPYTPAGGTSRGAVYVYEDDGSLWNQSEAILGSEDYAYLGEAVDLDGLTFSGQRLLVGAPGTDDNFVYGAGAAHIYLFDTQSGWALEDTIFPGSSYTYGEFGRTVKLIGTSAYVGSRAGQGNHDDVGRVELFNRVGSDWQYTDLWRGVDQEAGDLAGWSVAMDGNMAVVGVVSDNDSTQDGGAVYTFRRIGGNWYAQARLSAGIHAQYLGRFGCSVDIDGSLVVVGSEYEDVDGAQFAGSAYVFDLDVTLPWYQFARLTMAAPSGYENFGGAVAISGDTVVIGARRDSGSSSESGAAYTFRTTNGEDWVLEQKLQAPAGMSQDRFGSDVAIDGDTLLIGAEQSNSPGVESGSAYFFERSGGTWSFDKFVAESWDGTDTHFGAAVALSGDRAVIGAPGDHDAKGGVHLYERIAGEWTRTREFRGSDSAAGDEFGASVDIEGRHVIVGAAEHHGADFRSGAAYVYQKAGSYWIETKLMASDGAINDRFGKSVGVSGDHYVAGAPYANLDVSDAGATYGFELPAPPAYSPYGFGDGSFGPCPCGNESVVGAQEGCTNSSGRGARLRVEGSTSLSAADLELVGEGFPPGKTCLLIMGLNRHLDGPQLGDGLLAVTGGITRIVYRTADAAGEASWDDIYDYMTVGADDVRTFQAWYRDSVSASCGTGSNLSSGIEVTFEQ